MTATLDQFPVVAEGVVKDFPIARVEKYSLNQVLFVRRATGLTKPQAEDLRFFCEPYEVCESRGNLLTTAGLGRLSSLLVGAGGQALTNGYTRIGTGNGTGAAGVGDTDLSAAAGSANRWFQMMDATYPTQSNGVVTLRSTFGTSDGNFAWNEWGVDVGNTASGNTVAAVLFNHKTSANLGTKTSGSWVLTVIITFA